MKRALWCTQKKAHITSLALVIAGAIPNIHIFFRLEPIHLNVSSCEHPVPFIGYTDIGSKPQVSKAVQYGKFFLIQLGHAAVSCCVYQHVDSVCVSKKPSISSKSQLQR
jgi:hypothetical protein